jgi:hypothetical protein
MVLIESVSRFRCTVARVRAFVAALVVAMIWALASPTSADAVAPTGTAGRPGRADLPAKMAGWALDVGSGYMPAIQTTGTPYLYRSSATTGAQVVSIDWTVWRYTSTGWEKRFYASRDVLLRTSDPGSSVDGLSQSISSKYITTVSARLQWWTSNSGYRGTWLGSMDVTWYTSASDWMCTRNATAYLGCEVGAGWVRFNG